MREERRGRSLFERLLGAGFAILVVSLLPQCGAAAEGQTRLAVLRTVSSTDTGLAAFLAELDRHGYRQGRELTVSGRDAVYSDLDIPDQGGGVEEGWR